MNILKIAALSCGVSLSLASTAIAASSKLITEFTEANVRQALVEVGATDIEFARDQRDNKPLMYFTADGLNYIFVFLSCQQGPCRALNMTVSFEPGSEPYPLSLANGFNEYRAAATAVVHGDGGLKLNRYLIAREGITFANFVFNVRVFMGMPEALREYIAQRPVASLPGVAVPASGSTLAMPPQTSEMSSNGNTRDAASGRMNKLLQ
jgi:hypothetical protein